MKHSSTQRISSAMVALISIVFAAGAGFSANSIAKDATEAVRAVLTKSASAFERGDMATMEKLWANDETVTVFESGHANYGWPDYRDKHLGPEMKEMKNIKYSLSDIRAKVSGHTAWATFKYAISADVGTRHLDSVGLGTAVLEKRGDGWRIVHWHSSAPRRAPAPAPTPATK